MERETFTVSIPAEAYRLLAWRANLEGCTVGDLAARWAEREAEEIAHIRSLRQCGACGAYQDADSRLAEIVRAAMDPATGRQPRRPQPGRCIECGSADLHPAQFTNWQAARYARTKADGFDGLTKVLCQIAQHNAGD